MTSRFGSRFRDLVLLLTVLYASAGPDPGAGAATLGVGLVVHYPLAGSYAETSGAGVAAPLALQLGGAPLTPQWPSGAPALGGGGSGLAVACTSVTGAPTSYAIASNVVGLPSGNAPRSIAVWVRVSSMASNGLAGGSLIAWGTMATAGGVFSIRATNTGVLLWAQWALFLAPTSVFAEGGGTPEWHHVAVTYDSDSDLTVYVDAALVRSGPVLFYEANDDGYSGLPGFGGVPGSLTTTAVSDLTLGTDCWTGGGNGLTGVLADARVYNRSLSAAEVTALVAAFSASSSPSPTGTSSVTSSVTGTMTSTSTSTGSHTQPATGSASPTGTSLPSSSVSFSSSSSHTAAATLSSTPTPSSTVTSTVSSGYCASSLFVAAPCMELIGESIGVAVSEPSEASCRRLCCDSPGCSGYTFNVEFSLGFGKGGCYLKANVTQVIPNTMMNSGVLASAF